jgi:hypothetical protein
MKFRKRSFTLIEISIVFGLLLMLLLFGGIGVYKAITAHYFKESVKMLDHKIDIAKKIARATRGASSIAFKEEKETFFCTLDGETLPTKEIRGVLKERMALSGITSITLDGAPCPFTLSFLPSGQTVKDGDAILPSYLEITGSRADESHTISLNTKEEEKEDGANFPEEVLQDHS